MSTIQANFKDFTIERVQQLYELYHEQHESAINTLTALDDSSLNFNNTFGFLAQHDNDVSIYHRFILLMNPL